ncbi:MAG: hypothetical protein ABF542_08745 [Gluconobacter sp.]
MSYLAEFYAEAAQEELEQEFVNEHAARYVADGMSRRRAKELARETLYNRQNASVERGECIDGEDGTIYFNEDCRTPPAPQTDAGKRQVAAIKRDLSSDAF